jgi:hypothetical protein
MEIMEQLQMAQRQLSWKVFLSALFFFRWFSNDDDSPL